MIHMLIAAFVLLCIIGVILWGIQRIPGIPEVVKTVIYVLVAVICLAWLYTQFVGGAGLRSLS